MTLKLDDDEFDVRDLPAGAVGTADIYTDHVQIKYFIRRMELHMNSWLNFVIP